MIRAFAVLNIDSGSADPITLALSQTKGWALCPGCETKLGILAPESQKAKLGYHANSAPKPKKRSHQKKTAQSGEDAKPASKTKGITRS